MSSQQKGDGCIGLTKAGQILDIYVTTLKHTDKTQAKMIIKFIQSLTKQVNYIHDNLPQDGMKTFILKLARDYYKNKLNVELKQHLDNFPYSLMENYIVALTKVNFSPVTKTQLSLQKD